MLARATLTTARAALVGFAMSAVLGVLAAVVLASSRLLERAFYPYAVFFQTVPIVAIAPLLVIWFGPGDRAVSVSAFIVSRLSRHRERALGPALGRARAA